MTSWLGWGSLGNQASAMLGVREPYASGLCPLQPGLQGHPPSHSQDYLAVSPLAAWARETLGCGVRSLFIHGLAVSLAVQPLARYWIFFSVLWTGDNKCAYNMAQQMSVPHLPLYCSSPKIICIGHLSTATVPLSCHPVQGHCDSHCLMVCGRDLQHAPQWAMDSCRTSGKRHWLPALYQHHPSS